MQINTKFPTLLLNEENTYGSIEIYVARLFFLKRVLVGKMIYQTLFSITLFALVINAPLYAMKGKERRDKMGKAEKVIAITFGQLNNHKSHKTGKAHFDFNKELEKFLAEWLKKAKKHKTLPSISEENKDKVNAWVLEQTFRELKKQIKLLNTSNSLLEEERQEFETTRNELKRSNRTRRIAIGAGLLSTSISIIWSLIFLRSHNSCDV